MTQNNGSINFAPRKQMAYSTVWNPEKQDRYITSTFTLFMTEREKLIELGTSWVHGPLKKGECIMSKTHVAELNLTGSVLAFDLSMSQTFKTITEDYNILAR